MWQYTGKRRPEFADEPGPNQESVWDYPRPPTCVVDSRHVLVRHGSSTIADTHRALRVLETASPPTFYIPRSDVDLNVLRPSPGQSFCEWKGAATYWSLTLPDEQVKNVAWSYERPNRQFNALQGYLAFYPALVECVVAGEAVRPQPGGFYGGWVTDDIAGPFKGESGTGHW